MGKAGITISPEKEVNFWPLGVLYRRKYHVAAEAGEARVMEMRNKAKTNMIGDVWTTDRRAGQRKDLVAQDF